VKRERWITIGVVQWPWFVFEMGTGSPGGFLMTWRGRLVAFQPTEFRRAEHLCWAVERRLQLSRLQWVAIATEIERRGLYGERAVKVLVRRFHRGGAEAQRQ
jgi:hypothetical protein